MPVAANDTLRRAKGRDICDGGSGPGGRDLSKARTAQHLDRRQMPAHDVLAKIKLERY